MVRKVSIHQLGNDFSYWQSQLYEALLITSKVNPNI